MFLQNGSIYEYLWCIGHWPGRQNLCASLAMPEAQPGMVRMVHLAVRSDPI